MYVRTKPTSQLGEFGVLAQTIIGAVQSAALGAATAVDYSSVKKYLKKEKHTVRRAGAAALETKQEELAARKKALQAKGQTELLKDIKTKKLVILGGAVAIGLTILSIVIFYLLTVEDENE